MNHADKISKACKSLIFTEPFYGLFLVGLNKHYSKEIPTAGVSVHGIGVKLTINPDFVDGLSMDHTMGLLKHELLHIAFGHLQLRDKYKDKKLFNIAADLEINQYIDAQYLPEGGLTLESFPELNLPYRAGTETYYKLLSDAQNVSGDGESCPSLNNILNEMDADENHQTNHPTWDEFESLSDTEQKMIEKQVEHQIKESAEVVKKSRGSLPGELSQIFDKLFKIEPPKFDWRGYMRKFASRSINSYTKKLKRKFNKRYAANPGLKIKFKSHICVAIDVSGSVSDDELKEFFSEIHHMHKTGHKLTIVQCDTRIRSIKDYDPKKDWTVDGRGGTSFQPVVDHYNQFGRYTALIYLTDGEAWAPDNCPKQTLWVHSSKCSVNEALPGQKIQLN